MIDDFDLGDFGAAGFDLGSLTDADMSDSAGIDTRLHRRPPRQKVLRPRAVKHKHAVELARDVWPIEPGEAVHCVVDGRFIYGELIEAMAVKHNYFINDLWIMTLTLSATCIESLKNLYAGGYIRNMHLIISDYWYANERHESGLLPFMYAELGGEPGFQLSTCRSHAKITLMDIEGHGKQVIHGSANLRSSSTIDQFTVERDDHLFDFHRQWLSDMENLFWTVNANRPTRGLKTPPKSKQWETLNG